MEGKWTQGEWRLAELHTLGLYDNDGSAKILAGRGDDSVAVASVAAHASMKRGQGSNLADPERDANARLIAAAPALYEALDKIAQSGVALGGHHRALAVAALSQALGEPS